MGECFHTDRVCPVILATSPFASLRGASKTMVASWADFFLDMMDLGLMRTIPGLALMREQCCCQVPLISPSCSWLVTAYALFFFCIAGERGPLRELVLFANTVINFLEKGTVLFRVTEVGQGITLV